MSDQMPEPLAEVLHELPGLRISRPQPRRVRLEVAADRLHALLELLKGRAGYLHLSAISCVDWPESGEFELVYHLWSYDTRVMVSAHVTIPREPGHFVSVYDIHVPAGFFERDIHEMFGILFEGAPDQEPFILSEWHGPPPMRKEFSTVDYVDEHYGWQEYSPEWLEELKAKGGFVE